VDYRFIGLLEAAPDATICVDGQGVITLVNAQAERLFGYCRDDLLGKPVEILIPETVREVHPQHRAAYIADPLPRPMGAGMELAGRRRDGSTFPAEISLAAIETDSGPLLTAAVRDVSDQRRMYEATTRLASIIQSSHDAVVGKTLDMTVTSWNPAAERLYGYTAEEMLGQHIQVLLPSGELEQEREMLAAVIRGERVEEHQTHRIRKDGSTIAVSLTISPITSVTGEITGIATIARDFSERQRSEARFISLLEAAPDAMVCVDRTGKIALLNAQAERLFGYERDEIVGQPVEVLVPEQARANHPATEPSTWGNRSRGRWARGWSWPGGAGTAAHSRPRSHCRLSRPTMGCSSPPPSGMSPSDGPSRLSGSGSRLRPSGTVWSASFSSRSAWRASASWRAGSPMTSTTCSA
jgi:PAS domain S-box-containing protein